jgi:hypothetical protein
VRAGEKREVQEMTPDLVDLIQRKTKDVYETAVRST